MTNYTVLSTDRGAFTGVNKPLNAVRAFYKVRELRDDGFTNVTLRNVETGEQITDVESLMRGTPYA